MDLARHWFPHYRIWKLPPGLESTEKNILNRLHSETSCFAWIWCLWFSSDIARFPDLTSNVDILKIYHHLDHHPLVWSVFLMLINLVWMRNVKLHFQDFLTVWLDGVLNVSVRLEKGCTDCGHGSRWCPITTPRTKWNSFICKRFHRWINWRLVKTLLCNRSNDCSRETHTNNLSIRYFSVFVYPAHSELV